MKINLLSFPLLCFYFSGSCFAAAFERSGQSVQPFFESGNYAEIAFAYIYPNISGQVQHTEALQQLGVNDFSTGSLSDKQVMMGAALKLQLTPQIKFAVLYDQPFAVAIDYHYSPMLDDENPPVESANIDFESHSLTTLLGYQLTPNWEFYAGLNYQSLAGDLKLDGQTYYMFNGYDVHLKRDTGLGWLAGVSYQIPEYYLRTSLTYRSAVKHQHTTTESIEVDTITSNATTVKTPQSINFDFMTGLPYQNILYGTVRWVNWQDFVIQPPKFKAIIDNTALFYPEVKDFKLINYQEDQWSAKLGLAHLWNEQWLSSIELLWDSGINNPASSLNPSDGYQGIGLGGMYKYSPQFNIAAGLYYLKLNDSKVSDASNPLPKIAGLSALNDNDIWVFGLKFLYYF